VKEDRDSEGFGVGPWSWGWAAEAWGQAVLMCEAQALGSLEGGGPGAVCRPCPPWLSGQRTSPFPSHTENLDLLGIGEEITES
jgi:hypothetical protein